ncbi:hypothetical protein V8C43DRAFT_281109 [Trichoderma afarasin]
MVRIPMSLPSSCWCYGTRRRQPSKAQERYASLSISLSLFSLSAAEVALAAVKMEDNGMGVSNLWQAAKRPDSLVVLQHSALLSRGGQR